MRDALGIDKSIDILDYVHSLPDNGPQQEAQLKLQAIERNAMVNMEAQPALVEVMDFIDKQKIPKAILTRNFPIPVEHLLTTFLTDHQFAPIVTREFKPPKPSPAGLYYITKAWNVDSENVVMVGDSIDDMLAGYRAGAATVLVSSDVNGHIEDAPETDVVVKTLGELIKVLEEGIELKPKAKEEDPLA